MSNNDIISLINEIWESDSSEYFNIEKKYGWSIIFWESHMPNIKEFYLTDGSLKLCFLIVSMNDQRYLVPHTIQTLKLIKDFKGNLIYSSIKPISEKMHHFKDTNSELYHLMLAKNSERKYDIVITQNVINHNGLNETTLLFPENKEEAMFMLLQHDNCKAYDVTKELDEYFPEMNREIDKIFQFNWAIKRTQDIIENLEYIS